MEVTHGVTTFLKRILQNVLPDVTYLPSHRLVGTTFISIQSTLCAAPDLCKTVSLAALFGSNGNLHSFSVLSDMSPCTPVLHAIVKLVGQKRNGQQ